jgi:hypothetical protein
MTSTVTLSAVQHIRRMRGGSQAHLMRGSDGNFHVVKFQNNLQHVRVLANEFLATKIGLLLGLPMPEVQVIEVSDWLITHTPDLRMETAGTSTPCSSGLQLAVRYVADPERATIFDYLPESMFERIVNRLDFHRILAFDKWTGNCDGRQAVFTKRRGQPVYYATFIDQGYCFNAGEWTFPDSQLRGTYPRYSAYREVTGWESFEPVLSRIESFDSAVLAELAAQIPEEWYEYDAEGLCRLVEMLDQRRPLVRELITTFRNSARNPFPHWINKGVLPSGKRINKEEASRLKHRIHLE